MKILIMGFTKLKYMPYMNFYLDNIKKDVNDIHIIYWNRDLQGEDIEFLTKQNIQLHEFRCYQEDDVTKISKIKSFVKYRAFAKRLLLDEDFDFIFVLHSLTGVLVCDILEKKYKERYIFDYRDSTYEKFVFFKNIVNKLVENSKATFVSSDAFRRFLPESEKNKIFTSHNLLLDSLEHRTEKELKGISSDKIRIAFWGFIRHEELNREIIKKISKDSRFELHYYGREQKVALNLKEYASSLMAKNVFFHGEYKPKDRYKFVRETDIIHNIYCDANTMLAMGNKFYDGIIFKIPQLCMNGSFMGECVVESKIGMECNPYDDLFTEHIYNYYINMDRKKFFQDVEKVFNNILREYNDGCRYISNVTSNRSSKN